jgi:hypothetical protein
LERHSHRSLNLVYRWRWLWVAPWVAAALAWWTCLIEPVVWGYGGPGNMLLSFVYFYWKGYDLWSAGLTRYDGLRGVLGIDDRNFTWFLTVAAPALLWLAHIAFLGVRRHSDMALPARRRPGAAALVTASLMAGLLTCAVVVEVLSVEMLWWRFINLNLYSLAAPVRTPLPWWKAPAVPLLVVSWAVWWVVLWRWWCRRERFWQFERLTKGLVVAAAVVLVAGLLIHRNGTLFSNHEEDADFTALTLAGTVLLWAWGERVLLLFRLRRYERAWEKNPPAPECFACGYDLRGSAPGGACPECGAARPVQTGAAVH